MWVVNLWIRAHHDFNSDDFLSFMVVKTLSKLDEDIMVLSPNQKVEKYFFLCPPQNMVKYNVTLTKTFIINQG